MKIGDRCFVHGYVNEIRKDTVIIKNKGGYFGTDPGEVITAYEVYDTTYPNWIPCSERMPDELEEVNVTWVNHKPEPYYDFVKGKPFTASAVYYKGDWYWYSSVCTDLLAERGENEIDKIDDAIEITAWMPLPEPYKGDKDEN